MSNRLSLLVPGLLLSLASALLLSGSADERRISVYSKAANYSLPIVERNGTDYVGLLEVLEPLGTVSARVDKNRWKFRYNDTESEFTKGKSRARIQNRDFDLSGNFLLENGRGWVPLSSLGTLLSKILGGPVTFNLTARRLFIGNVAVHFTAQIAGSTPPALVMNFSAPVNPTVATEPGKLHMTFNHEAVVTPGSATLTFNSKVIPSASFTENNGAAEVTVNTSVPMMASFSNDGRTITIAPPEQIAAAKAQPSANPSSAGPANPLLSNQSPTSRYFAVIDAAHGGSERGAALTEQLAEKDVTMVFARRLRQELENHGLSALLLRDGDDTLTLDQRATRANSAAPAIYICIHATSVESGVRLYTAMIPTSSESRGPFLDWNSAQLAFLGSSQTAEASAATELRSKQIPAGTLTAALRPLNNITAAAIAVEIGPSGNDVTQLTAPAYQQSVISALAIGIANARDKLGAAPR